MDRTVKPGADFFLFANGAWYAKAEIPADCSFTGVDLRVEEEAEARTKQILDAAALAKAEAGSDVQKMGDFYATYLDEAGIEARGAKAMAKALDRIAKLADKRALSQLLGSQLRADVDPLNATDFYTEPRARPLGRAGPQRPVSRRALSPPGRARDARPELLPRRGGPDGRRRAGEVSSARRSDVAARGHQGRRRQGREDLRVREEPRRRPREPRRLGGRRQGQQPLAPEDFTTRAKGLDWDAFFAPRGLGAQPSFIVWHPSASTGLAALVKSEPLHDVEGLSDRRALDPPLVSAEGVRRRDFAFQEKSCAGSRAPSAMEAAIDLTNDALGEAVGKAYVERYFPAGVEASRRGSWQTILAAFGRASTRSRGWRRRPRPRRRRSSRR